MSEKPKPRKVPKHTPGSPYPDWVKTHEGPKEATPEEPSTKARELVEDRPNLLCDETPFGSYCNQVTMVPPARLGIDGPVGIDLCLASEIACLWALGIKTLSSCCGHGREPGYIAVAPIHAQEMGCLWYDRDEERPGLHIYHPQTGCAAAYRDETPETTIADLERRAHSEGEPVAWMVEWDDGTEFSATEPVQFGGKQRVAVPLYTAPPEGDVREALEACEESLRLVHEAAGPVEDDAPMPKHSTFEAWKMAAEALGLLGEEGGG